MGIGLTPKLVEVATKVTTTRNEYGDVEYGGTQTRPCLYRDISMLQRGAGNKEQIQIDGLLWFDSDENIVKGDIYAVNGEYLRIEKIIRAKRLVADNALKFIKCEVTKQRQVS